MSQVPNELWFEIFHYLPRDTVKDVSFTHRRFARLSRPLRFTDFDFHPYELHGLRLPSADEVQRSLERLTFWCSDDIAPLVRACHVVPWMENVGPVGSFSPTDTPYVLLSAFFERLPCFTRLQRLYCWGVHFTRIGMANLCRLPLAHLRISNCRVAAGETIEPASQPLRLSSFLLHNDINSEDELDHWIALLHPECLRELDLMCNPRLFNEAIAALPSFPHVRKLAAKIWLSTGTLSKFPALEVLDNGPVISHDPPLQSTLLPVLKEYTGSHENLHLFIPATSLFRLTTRYCSPHELITQLHGIRTTKKIISLDTASSNMGYTAFETLCEFLGHLTELRIRIPFDVEQCTPEDKGTPATCFLKALSDNPILPPTLEHLVLNWELFYFGFESEEVPRWIEPPDLAELRDALVDRCPGLTSLWIDGQDFLLRWCKFPDGTVDERTAYGGRIADKPGEQP
ncbi:hypothetical protein C8R44DRAFT_985332 [Mycena epipterygia]|nr:hypothetical protein C8R44DRAFT_985332 [Mycena epipterygia]